MTTAEFWAALVVLAVAAAVLFFGCAGPGERWACTMANGSVLKCQTVQEP